MNPELHPEVPGQQVKERDSSLFSSETSLAVLPPALELPTQGHGTAGASPEEAAKMIRGLVYLPCERQAEEIGSVESEEGKASRKHHTSISVPEGSLQER